MAKQPEDNKTRDLFNPRGAYSTYEKYGAGGSGGFIYSLRRQRNMTQAQYAAFLGCSLRTLVTAEKERNSYAPWGGSAVGYGLANKEFNGKLEMEAAFAAFVKERAR